MNLIKCALFLSLLTCPDPLLVAQTKAVRVKIRVTEEDTRKITDAGAN
jgi:hypothetical protein